eukprot:CAMPEP_0197828882 /NCGR_PEP_ID=MMETSP1437-20131217/5389_1 /TAXON_ID=49252 ORGANISM="Eucampia antarctica, Strain CCMP1452" /NCGR_SAMPLE_ID=MMETSP1437 /ASSEMBLY_ACC=CAM_ASM_001096 /LENGTH=327 /DNA_ID=CAMNT_0043430291 /DNA_START=28 /DNA_END=1011 /DNA_ORIENTATION=-
MTSSIGNSFLSFLGVKLFSLNPSLMEEPPAGLEVTGNDICFFGPNGERDVDSVTFCRELPDGKRALLGSWYLSPERHVAEGLFFFILFIGCVMATYSKLAKRPGLATPPSLVIRLLTGFCFFTTLAYKIVGYSGKILFFVMPCNVSWSLAFLVCFYPNLSAHASHVLCQLIFASIGLCVLAIAAPDTSDLILPGEISFFFFSHYSLLMIPIFHTTSGHLSTLPDSTQNEGWVSCFFKWTLYTTGMTGLFYFCFVTILSIFSGHNLNYMLSPPPTPGNFIDGPNFRVMSAACIFILFAVTRILGMMIGIMVKFLTQLKVASKKTSKIA